MTDSTSGKPEEIAPANLDEVEDKELETEAAEDETGAGENDEEVDPADDTPAAANPASGSALTSQSTSRAPSAASARAV